MKNILAVFIVSLFFPLVAQTQLACPDNGKEYYQTIQGGCYETPTSRDVLGCSEVEDELKKEACESAQNYLDWTYCAEGIDLFYIDRFFRQASLDQCEADLELCLNPPPPIEPPVTFSRFLWKPESDNTGKLAILNTPGVDKMRAIGPDHEETLRNFGASNGYLQTWRANHEGCDFGSKDVRVEAYNSDQLVAVVEIGDGCERQLQ